jgi:hypothetical protein
MPIEDQPPTFVQVATQLPPIYEVTFFQLMTDGPPSAPPMFESEGHRLVGSQDVVEVLEWAETHAVGRTYTIEMEVPAAPPELRSTHGFIPIYGIDPTRSPEAD